MPQLIAMVIVVVGAMIYMFQTCGGTGDKIEGIAQKTSIVTEINNIRNGLQLAVRAEDIEKSVTAVAAQAAVANIKQSNRNAYESIKSAESKNNAGADIVRSSEQITSRSISIIQDIRSTARED